MSVSKYFLLLTGAIVALVSWYYLSLDQQSTPKTEHSVLHYSFADTYSRYKVEYLQKNRLYLDGNGGEIKRNLHIDATLNTKTLQHDTNGSYLLMELSELTLKSSDISNITKGYITQAYQKMFMLHVASNGEIDAIYFNGLEKNFEGIKQFIYALDIVLKTQKEYIVHQFDVLGEYEAYYRQQNQTINKMKKRYITSPSLNDEQSIKIVKSLTKAIINEHGNWFEDVSLHETLKVLEKNHTLLSVNSNDMNLTYIDNNIDNSLDIYAEHRAPEAIIESFAHEAKSDTPLFETIAKANTKAYIKRHRITLKKITKKLNEEPYTTQKLRMLKRYIDIYPKEIPQLKAFIQNSSDLVARRSLAILGSVGSKEAQQLLCDISEDENFSDINQLRAIVALGDIKKGNEATIQKLVELSQNREDETLNRRANTALLALGSVAKRGDELQKSEAIERIQDSFYATKSDAQRRVILYAMENLGAEYFINELEIAKASKSKKLQNLANSLLQQIDK